MISFIIIYEISNLNEIPRQSFWTSFSPIPQAWTNTYSWRNSRCSF